MRKKRRPVNDWPHSPLLVRGHSSFLEFSWVQPLEGQTKQKYVKNYIDK